MGSRAWAPCAGRPGSSCLLAPEPPLFITFPPQPALSPGSFPLVGKPVAFRALTVKTKYFHFAFSVLQEHIWNLAERMVTRIPLSSKIRNLSFCN